MVVNIHDEFVFPYTIRCTVLYISYVEQMTWREKDMARYKRCQKHIFNDEIPQIDALYTQKIDPSFLDSMIGNCKFQIPWG